jgi:hypothetical protein
MQVLSFSDLFASPFDVVLFVVQSLGAHEWAVLSVLSSGGFYWVGQGGVPQVFRSSVSAVDLLRCRADVGGVPVLVGAELSHSALIRAWSRSRVGWPAPSDASVRLAEEQRRRRAGLPVVAWLRGSCHATS